MSEEEFLAMNYRRFTILHRRHLRLRWQQEYLQGCIASAIYATGFARPKKPPNPEMFCFTQRPGESGRWAAPQGKQEIADVFRSLTRPATGGIKK
jgi:hypothetical protein